MTEATLPLAGLRVLDISTYIAGPAAAVVLGDYGADVIKVEQPGEGDPNRSIISSSAYPKSPVNYPWMMDSRNKRSIALDLKHPGGRAALDPLIRRADVLITNFPLPVRDRLRLGYAHVADLNDRLIYASLTGFGEAGPDRNQPGFDSTAYFARSGLCDQVRYDGQPPHFSLPAQGDRPSAIGLVAGIMMALYQRERTGKGTAVSTSLLANGLWSNGVYAQAALVGGFLPLRPPRHAPRSALSNIYRTSDGRWVLISLPMEERLWPRLCGALQREDLCRDARFAETPARRDNAAALTAILDAECARHPASELTRRLKDNGLTFSLINRIEDIAGDEQAVAAGAVVPTANPDMPRTLAAPFRLASSPPRTAGPAPELGQHTDDILLEAGLDPVAIAELRRSGAAA
jgi:crotonobetainyl-CoA:carnitine CoA-transferase CaiB-like acyl-CoA transferase